MARPPWLQRIWTDLTTREFLPIKAVLFLTSGAMFVLFPFMTIHARSLGITEQELSVLNAFNPIIALFGPPITGLLADKIGNFKVFLSSMTVVSGCTALLYLAIPMARERVPMPDLVPLSLGCGGDAQFTLQLPSECQIEEGLSEFNVTFTNCSQCEMFRARGSPEGAEVAVTVTSSSDVNASVWAVKDWTCPRSVLELRQNAPQQVDDFRDPKLIHYNETSASEVTSPCGESCRGLTPREGVCSNNSTMKDYSPMTTLSGYLLVRLLNIFTIATTLTLFNGAAMAILKEHDGDYGLQKVYGSLGSIFLTPISGVLIDVFSKVSGKQDFRPAFFLYFGLKLACSFSILCLKLDFKLPSKKVVKDFRSIVKKPEILVFFVVMLVSGTCFGVLDTFLFWLLQDLGARKSLMGITVSVGTAAGIPILLVSRQIIQKLGHVNTIILGFAFYVIRMLGYSLITNPWWCLPFEMLECFTVSLMSTAAVTYTADLSTPATIASLQGMYGGIHYGVGRGLGSLLGGFLIAPFGIRNTFRSMSVVCLVTCVTYFFVNRMFFRKDQLEREEKRKEDEKKNVKGETKDGKAANTDKDTDNTTTKDVSEIIIKSDGALDERNKEKESNKDGDKNTTCHQNPTFERD